MEKQDLINQITEKVAEQLEASVLDQFSNFEITMEVPGKLIVLCDDKLSGGKNTCTFEFNWYN